MVRVTLWPDLAPAQYSDGPLGGYVAAERWSHARQAAREAFERQRERDREDFQNSRERASQEYALRTELGERAIATASRMFIACQHARRALRQQHANPPAQTGDHDAIFGALDETYLSFAVESNALETLLGARYGINWKLSEDDEKKRVYVRWHQIRDLLTLYYFNVRGHFPGDALRRNSLGFEGRYHAGIDASSYLDDASHPQPAELKLMRTEIRRSYDDALAELVEGILRDSVIM